MQDKNRSRKKSGSGNRSGNRNRSGSGNKSGNRNGNRQQSGSQNKNKFTIKMQKKLIVLFGIVLLAFAGLSWRLYMITKEDGEKYKKQVLSQQKYDSTTLPFKRGDIVDSKGTPLAVSEKVYNVILDTRLMLQDKEALEPTVSALVSQFGLNEGELRQYINDNPSSAYKVLAKRLSYSEISDFIELQEDTKSNPHLVGVWFEEEYKRSYPNGSLACDVIGFTGTDNTGTYGLEEYYNDTLNGTPGRVYGYLSEDSTFERTTKAAVDGNNIVSTIDVNIQSIAEKYLKEFNDAHLNEVREGNGAENLGCIIMEVDSGEILAMASYPVFDLNNPRNNESLVGANRVEEVVNANGYIEIRKTGTAINEEVLGSMTDDEVYLNLNNLWKNYCISDTYEPGSTAKPFTVAAALESGAITGNEVYQCDGALEVGGHTIKCHSYRYGGEGAVSVKDSIALSCNVGLMKIAQALGSDAFVKYQNAFSFGLRTRVDLAGEARTAGLLYAKDTMGPSELATNSFGQSFNVTMIQMITGFCSLLNGGYYYEPHTVSKVVSSTGATVENIEPRILKQTVSASTSEKIVEYCNAVVTEGTGHSARPAGYAIGGKTGTAETIPRGNREYVVSFMGYAPADDPQIAIYVVVDRPNVPAQDDAKYATQIVRNILTEVLPYLHIYMTEELSEAEIKELEERDIAITTQYGAAEEGEKETEEATQEGEEGESTEEESEAEEGENQNRRWESFPIDPATGYAIDPDTNEFVDPLTGAVIGGDSLLDGVGSLGEPITPATVPQSDGSDEQSSEETSEE